MSFLQDTSASRKNLFVLATISAVSFFISLMAWGLSSPLGSSPDEDFHIGSIWCADGFSTDTCQIKEFVPGANQQIVKVPHVMDLCFMRESKKSGDCSGDPESIAPDLRANNKLQYPPIFYRFMHTFVSEDTESSGITMRLVNSILASMLLFAAIVLSQRRVRNALLIGFVGTLVPLAMFLIPSLNPSAWAYLGLAFAWVFFMNATTQHNPNNRNRNANLILFFLCLVMAIGSRWDSGLYVFVSVIAVSIAINLFHNLSVDLGVQQFNLIRGVFVAGAILIAFYYIPRLIDVGRNGIFGTTRPDSEWSPRNLFLNNVVNLIEIPAGIFGYGPRGLGWLDTPLPGIVSLIGTSIYAFFILQSIPFRQRRYYTVVVMLTAFCAFILIFSLTSGGFPVGDSIQPRYILPMMPVILGLAIWSSRAINPFGAEPRARAIVIGVLISLAHAVSLWTNIRRYTAGLRINQGFNLNSPLEWWWGWAPSPNFVFLIGVLSFSIFIYAAFKLILTQSESKTESTISNAT
jgi:hypothetical protein